MRIARLSKIHTPGKKYIRQPALEMPLIAPIERETGSGGQPGEEPPANIHTILPEPTASGYPEMPEMALAQVSVTPATVSSRVDRAETTGPEGSEATDESVAAPDIDAIARDVYRILKRRLMAERERALGVF
jgi:hypothetical protein